jgi:hypothetical protein
LGALTSPIRVPFYSRGIVKRHKGLLLFIKIWTSSFSTLMPSPNARHEIPGDARLAKRMDRDLLPPMQAIHAATGGAALILGADKELGTIEVGKWADLVFLDADPVADIRNTRRIWNVMHNGQLIDRSAILKTIKPASV